MRSHIGAPTRSRAVSTTPTVCRTSPARVPFPTPLWGPSRGLVLEPPNWVKNDGHTERRLVKVSDPESRGETGRYPTLGYQVSQEGGTGGVTSTAGGRTHTRPRPHPRRHRSRVRPRCVSSPWVSRDRESRQTGSVPPVTWITCMSGSSPRDPVVGCELEGLTGSVLEDSKCSGPAWGFHPVFPRYSLTLNFGDGEWGRVTGRRR